MGNLFLSGRIKLIILWKLILLLTEYWGFVVCSLFWKDNLMIYQIFYYVMLFGYLGVSLLSGDIKSKIIGILLLIVNGLIFYKG